MSPEQKLLAKWRSLPKDKQEEVLDFVELIHLKNAANKIPLGERLGRIRARIVASGKPLLDEDEIEKELASRRGRLLEGEPISEMKGRGQQMAAVLEKLAQAQAFAGIDPVAWQRDLRQDRELPGRDE